MKLPFFTTFVIFILWTTYQLKKHSNDEEDFKKNFWAREREANFTRKKPIDHLPYVVFTKASIPLHTELADERVQEYISILMELCSKKILNLTGESNTDLKLKYGAPNITQLTEYDQNYTTLVRTISRLGEKYLEFDLKDDARVVFEYGIQIGSDVRQNYEQLAILYQGAGDYARIEQLRESAMQLNSLSKGPILRFLDSLMPV